ncbi:MAG: 16S rRNA (cytidine(1402)-2'-O)-methyltransferase [Chloroflexota bacterium]
MGTLYLVATPIGNLGDITYRAVEVLGQVNFIAAEDTRQTRKLLSHYKIEAAQRLISYHEHSKDHQLAKIVALLDDGDVALVSDAGTPGINDPGFALVGAALDAGHQVVPVPGPSAPIAAIIGSGLPADSFLYLGYLPRKTAARVKALDSVITSPHTLIFLETPHRLVNALADIQSVLGDREIAVARELTKLYEEFFRGSVGQALAHFQDNPPRGEITLVIAGAADQKTAWSTDDLEKAVAEALITDQKPSVIARRLAAESGWPRRDIYDMVTRLRDEGTTT